MPRYHFRCKARNCSKETIVLNHEGHYVDTDYVSCGFCGGRVLLESFFADDGDARIIELQHKIEVLRDRCEMIEDSLEMPDLTESKEKLN